MDALILMTRIPVSGKTKTRLMKVLTGDECAEIHRFFLMDIFNTFENLRSNIDIYLTYTPNNCLNLIEDILPSNVTCFPQKGQNLGERMLNSIDFLLMKGYKKVVLIGSDIPDLKSTDIGKAFEILDSKDIVLGPTFDGGYYLIGMKKMYKELFSENLKWGYKSVFEGTVDISNKCNLKVGLAAKQRDIDTEEDLLSFYEKFKSVEYDEDFAPLNTIRYINKLWSDLDAERNIGR